MSIDFSLIPTQRGRKLFKTYSFDKYDKEPLEGVKNRVEIALVKVSFKLWKKFGEDFIVMRKESCQFRKAQDEQTMHCIFSIGQQSV